MLHFFFKASLTIYYLFPGFDDEGQFIPLHKRAADVAMFRGELEFIKVGQLFFLLLKSFFMNVNIQCDG